MSILKFTLEALPLFLVISTVGTIAYLLIPTNYEIFFVIPYFSLAMIFGAWAHLQDWEAYRIKVQTEWKESD